MIKNYKYDPKEAKIGFGTQHLRDQAILTEYIKEVNKGGYDFIDCAWRYGNEAIIGLSLKALKRQDAGFILNVKFQSKVWPTQFSGGITKSLKFTLQKIGAISAIDSYMLHRPAQDVDLNLSAWKQLIECRKNRLAKKIGLAHFDKDMMEKLYEETGIRPQYLQMELSVNNMRWDRIKYCMDHEIEIQAYEPLGDIENNLNNETLIGLSKKYNTTVKNILIAYLLNQGITPIVTVSSQEEIKEFLNAKEIVLDKDDIKIMSEMNTYSTKHFEGIEIDFKPEN